MEQPDSPHGLEPWINFLRDKPLPVHVRTSALLRDLLREPDTSLAQLQPVIANDPVFSAHVIGLANRLNRNPETDVSTTELAVSTLGIDHLQRLVEELPVMKPNPHSVPHKQYYHALDNSYHAAIQAANLCRFSNPAIINETRTAALVYGIGHWALWRYAPQRMSEIKIRIYEQGADTALAEHDVLGCTIQEISEQLVAAWQLSRLAEEALRHATSPDAEMLDRLHRYALDNSTLDDAARRAIKQLLNATFYPVKLANWLALTVPYGWAKPKAIRLIEIISDYLQHPPDPTLERLQHNCVQASRNYHVQGIMAPAALMLLLPSDQVLSYRLDGPNPNSPPTRPTPPAPIQPTEAAAPPATAPTAKATDAAALADEAMYRQVLERLAQTPSPYAGTEQLLTDLLRGLRLGLGLERVCLYRVEQSELGPYKQSGFAGKDPMPRFTQSLNVPSLFKKLAQRPLAVWINDDNRGRIWAELPERFTGICHQHSFALTSLFVSGRASYYLYADRADPAHPVTEFDFKHFKQLAAAASRGLNLPQAAP